MVCGTLSPFSSLRKFLFAYVVLTMITEQNVYPIVEKKFFHRLLGPAIQMYILTHNTSQMKIFINCSKTMKFARFSPSKFLRLSLSLQDHSVHTVPGGVVSGQTGVPHELSDHGV